MNKSSVTIDEVSIPVYSFNTIIIGSGAAALNAAIFLDKYCQKNIAIITEEWGGGTSNNAGSDKQTYYKLSLSGDKQDSPFKMAEDLFSGGSMHGDIALCEAQHSAQAFYNLVSLGVPFPHDKYGGFFGYKTDHDNVGRGTSAGPLTSHMMFENLAKEIDKRKISIFNKHNVISLLTKEYKKEKHIAGAVAIDKNKVYKDHYGLVVFNAVNVIMATGGPAGIYLNSVYPESQTGATGMALKIGAVGQNLTESQFGLASLKFRWNLSGSYQQVIPKYFSTDKNGRDEKEFLNEYFPDMRSLTSAIFLKGYQWPFDPGKLNNYGSSLIDFLVFQETYIKYRKVFIDYTRNPGGSGEMEEFSMDVLTKEAYSYLKKSDALSGTPVQRLEKMNLLAVELFQRNGINITKEPVEIAVCAQHNNGGLKGNIWWESNIKHLFPVGELNGSHGVYRPGGSALNAGQVGGIRAAMYISNNYMSKPCETDELRKNCSGQIAEIIQTAENMLDENKQSDEINNFRYLIQQSMSENGAFIRDKESINDAVINARKLTERIKNELKVKKADELSDAFRLLDQALTHIVYLEAIAEYIKKDGGSRGSYLIIDKDGKGITGNADDDMKYKINNPDSFVNRFIQEICIDNKLSVTKKWVEPKPVPVEDQWFEAVWKKFRENKIIK